MMINYLTITGLVDPSDSKILEVVLIHVKIVKYAGKEEGLSLKHVGTHQ